MWTLVSPSKPLLAATALLVTAAAATVLGTGCSRDGDPPLDVGEPSALGDSKPLHVLQDPNNADRLKIEPPATCQTSFSAPLTVQGVSVNWVDRYDETGEGAIGTVWIQDYKSQAPWSGSSLFSPSYVPSSLYLAGGDVIDLRGLYQVNVCIGARVNFEEQIGPGVVLAQVATPVTTFRFEGEPNVPVEVPITDFDSFETGRKWIGMLVTFRDVFISGDGTFNGGRFDIGFSSAQQGGTSITLSNELQALEGINRGARFASVTGIVTWFYNPFKLATRTPADFVPVQE